MPHNDKTVGTIPSRTFRIWEVRWDAAQGVWQVARQAAQSVKNFDTKAPAIKEARRRARNDAPSRLNILDKNGMIVDQSSYD